MKIRATDRTGFVLPAVIFALAIMGLLSVVSLRTADDEHRSSRALRESGAALYAAEAGANTVRGTVTGTPGTTLLDSIAVTLAPGDSADLGWKALPGGASYRAVIHRADGGTRFTKYTLTTEGRGAGLWGGRRAITMVFAANSVSMPPSFSALGSADGTAVPPFAVTLNGNSYLVDGKDTQMPSAVNPANLPAGCTAPTSENKVAFGLSSPESKAILDAEAGIDKKTQFRGLKPGSTTNEYQSGSSWDTTTTSPPGELQVLVDLLLPTATIWPSGSYTGVYGSPTNPGVFATTDGDLTFKGEGYGILIVTAGVLKISGNAYWEGLILAVGVGSIEITGSGNEIYGEILVANTQGGTTNLYVGGNAQIMYSSQALCRVEEEGLLVVSGVHVVSGSWMQLSR